MLRRDREWVIAKEFEVYCHWLKRCCNHEQSFHFWVAFAIDTLTSLEAFFSSSLVGVLEAFCLLTKCLCSSLAASSAFLPTSHRLLCSISSNNSPSTCGSSVSAQQTGADSIWFGLRIDGQKCRKCWTTEEAKINRSLLARNSYAKKKKVKMGAEFLTWEGKSDNFFCYV